MQNYMAIFAVVENFEAKKTEKGLENRLYKSVPLNKYCFYFRFKLLKSWYPTAQFALQELV